MKVRSNLVHSNVVSRLPLLLLTLGYIYFLLGDQLCLIEMFHLRAACTKNKSDEDDEEDQDGDDCHEDPNQRGHLGEKN